MSGGALALPARRAWRIVGASSAEVCLAERDALGTTARLAIWPADSVQPAVGAIDRELDRLDMAASRFRPDSELSRIQAGADGPVRVSAALAEALAVALAAARWTEGLVDPTVGAAVIALGYDRDFVLLGARQWDGQPVETAQVPGWRSLQLVGDILDMPGGIRLDLGATAKGLGADRAARAALAAAGAGGVLVSLGGDLAAAGEAPGGGWPVLVADEHRQSARSSRRRSPTQVVRMAAGGLATSSITCRQWRRAGQVLHHIVDPRTGLPAAGPWRTASVVAATCAEANAASAAAILSGDAAAGWLTAQGLPARLVSQDGGVLRLAGWPAAEHGQLALPQPRMPDLLADRAVRPAALTPVADRAQP